MGAIRVRLLANGRLFESGRIERLAVRKTIRRTVAYPPLVSNSIYLYLSYIIIYIILHVFILIFIYLLPLDHVYS